MLELNEYQNKGLIWYGCKNSDQINKVSTEYKALDEHLHGGFPDEGIIELKTPLGIGEIRLCLPYIVAKQKRTNADVVFIAPPIQLHAEFLLANGLDLDRTLVLTTYETSKKLWAAEQCLSSGCCSTIVLWQDQLEIKQVRRLMLACEKGGGSIILVRHSQQQVRQKHQSNSGKYTSNESVIDPHNSVPNLLSLPSSLSLTLSSYSQGIAVKVDKQKGGVASKFFGVDMTELWPDLVWLKSNVASGHKNNVVNFPNAVSH